MTGLEALNETVNKFADVILLGGHEERNATNLTNAIDYLERTPQIRTLRKCVKALEIIKEKRVDIEKIIFYGNVEDYNNSNVYKTLTPEEYETIKEVIE